MRLINYGNYSKDKDTIIGFEWDEAGVSLGNRQMAINNKQSYKIFFYKLLGIKICILLLHLYGFY